MYHRNFVCRQAWAQRCSNRNRQAAIKGLPKIEDEDAEKIMKVILASRGIIKTKQIEMWKEGNLQVTSQKLRAQVTAHGWGKSVEPGTDWTKDPEEDEAEAAGRKQRDQETIPLKQLVCPECHTHTPSNENHVTKSQDGIFQYKMQEQGVWKGDR